jgi:hypothetical protein
VSADQQQNDDQLDQDQQQGTDQDQAPPAGGDQGTEADKPLSRQERRDEQARQRAQELEAERDKLAGRLAAAQTREVERIAAQVLAQPGDLLALGGVTLADLTDPETGELLDEEEILGMAAALVDQRPGLSVNAEIKRGHHDWGHSRTRDNDMYAPGGTGAPSWSDAFGGASSR